MSKPIVPMRRSLSMFYDPQKKSGKIVMNEYKFLHDYLRELRLKKHEARKLKKNSSKNSLHHTSNPTLRKTKSLFLTGEQVATRRVTEGSLP